MKAPHIALAAWLAGIAGLAAVTPAQAQEVQKPDISPGVVSTPAVPEPPKGEFADFYDNTLGLRYSPSFAEPGIPKSNHLSEGAPIDKLILNFSHFDSHKYWTNFFSIDVLQSNDRDPRNGEPGNQNGNLTGATEFYAVYRGNLSGNAITDSSNFTFGPVRDVALEIGGDLNHKNTTFDPQKKLFVVGPNIRFDVNGFFNVGLHLAQEWNYNGIVQKSVTFTPYFQLEPTWLIPLTFINWPVVFEGFADINTPKGKDGFGNQTATEVLIHFDFALDAGKMLLDKPHFLETFVGFEYWLNKFGNNNSLYQNGTWPNAGSLAYSPLVGFRVHF